MKKEKCPTCGKEMFVRTENTPTENRAWNKLVKLKQIRSIHHILPFCHFKSKEAKQFTFELCRQCHEELELDIKTLGKQKLDEMKYIKTLIIFIIRKVRDNDSALFNNVVLGVFADARAYFNRIDYGRHNPNHHSC